MRLILCTNTVAKLAGADVTPVTLLNVDLCNIVASATHASPVLIRAVVLFVTSFTTTPVFVPCVSVSPVINVSVPP